MKLNMRVVLVVFTVFLYARAQENSGSSVSSALLECYNTTEYTKDRLLPSTINILIDLIRKVEDGPTAMDARQLAVQLIHRFRQDGITRSTSSSTIGVPFSPAGQQANRNRILLRRLIPGNAYTFPNDTLTTLERCSLHNMLSNTIDLNQRGDEGTTCNRLARYTVRVRRDVDDDIEIFDPKKGPTKGELIDGTDEEDIPAEGDTPSSSDDPEASESDAEVLTNRIADVNQRSQCPIEGGIIYTQWGAVYAGSVIAGIASGLGSEEINVVLDGTTYTVNSQYASTLVGDLSEASLHQGSVSETITVGGTGGWNSTTVPRYYFLSSNVNWEATDAEIRGGLDGIILSQNAASWISSVSSMKVSQILDMYYSPRGVFSSEIRACNRKALQTTYAGTDVLNHQTSGFNSLLDDKAVLPSTLSHQALITLGQTAVTAFLDYLPSNLNDLSCSATGENVTRAASDIIIILDTSWTYTTIQPALSYLLDYIDVNKYGTNYTLLSGNDGSVIVNSSRSLVDFHEQYNQTVHNSNAGGFSFQLAYNLAEEYAGYLLNNDTTLSGKSTIVLLVTTATSISNEDRDFMVQRRERFRSYVPDLRLLLLGSNSRNNYNDAVFDPNSDIFTLTGSSDNIIISSMSSVVNRVKEIHRKIVNPNCKADWSGTTLSSGSIDQYVEPNSINYYRISPNYFYWNTGVRRIRIRDQGYGSLDVCYSSTIQLPTSSSTDSVTCETINSGEVTYTFDNHCDGHSRIADCPPFYFSVAPSTASTPSVSYRCTDSGCRFPDNLKFTVTVENFGCANSSLRYLGSAFLLIIALVVSKLW